MSMLSSNIPLKLKCKGGKTKQSFKDECNINKIMEKFTKTGQLPTYIKDNPTFADFASLADYNTASNLVAKTKQQFELLSTEQKALFGNDPEKMLAFLDLSEQNKASIGLEPKKEVAQVEPQNTGSPVVPS